jgi:hypothetical protein
VKLIRAPLRPAKHANPSRDSVTRSQRDSDLDTFGSAITAFNAGKFQEAMELFDALKTSEDRGIAHAAVSRSIICERLLETRVSQRNSSSPE